MERRPAGARRPPPHRRAARDWSPSREASDGRQCPPGDCRCPPSSGATGRSPTVCPAELSLRTRPRAGRSGRRRGAEIALACPNGRAVVSVSLPCRRIAGALARCDACKVGSLPPDACRRHFATACDGSVSRAVSRVEHRPFGAHAALKDVDLAAPGASSPPRTFGRRQEHAGLHAQIGPSCSRLPHASLMAASSTTAGPAAGRPVAESAVRSAWCSRTRPHNSSQPARK